MMQIRNILVAWLLSEWLSAGHAVLPQFKAIEGLDKLPNATIRTVAQDPHGFIWAGTNRGVFRYDGHQIKRQFLAPEQPDPTADKRINGLHFDPSGRMWVATNTAGLWIFDPSQQLLHQPEQTTALNKISLVRPAMQAGGVWIGTGQGLFLASSSQHQAVEQLDAWLPDHPISAVLELNDGVWIGTPKGLLVLDRRSRVVSQPFPELSELTIHDLHQDDQQRLWVATSKGLYVQHAGNEPLQLMVQTGHNRVMDLQQVNQELWVATINGGLVVYDLTNLAFRQHLHDSDRPHALASDHLMSLFRDQQNNLWIGHFNAGLDLLPLVNLAYGLEAAHRDSFHCAPTADVYSLQVQGDDVMIGGFGGLSRYSETNGDCEFIFFAGDEASRNLIYDIEPALHGGYLLATGEGLFTYDAASDLPERVPLFKATDPLFFVVYDHTHRAYFLGGVDRLWQVDEDLSTVQSVPFEASEGFFYTTQDAAGQRYFASYYHVMALTNNGYLKTLYEEADGLNSLAVDAQGTVWIGSKKRGLLQLLPNGDVLEAFRDHPRLHDANIMSVTSYRGQIWMSSNKGLISFVLDTQQIVHHNSAWALQSMQFHPNAAFLTDQGVLYVGGPGGYNRLSLEAFPNSMVAAPAVNLTALKRFNRPVWPAQSDCELCIDQPIEQLSQLALDHRDDIVGFEWSAIEYANPDQTQFAYRLLGLEQDWNEVDSSDRNITYTSLRPGAYEFQLMASPDGVHWPDDPLNLAIAVSPAPWLSPWAYAIYAITLLLLTWFTIHRRTRAANLRAKQLEHKVAERTLELVDKNAVIEDLLRQKNALFANITHEFKTPLTLILGPINKLKKFLQSAESNHASQLADAQMIDRNANRLLNMVGHLLKLSAAEDLENQQKVTVQAAVIAAMIVDSFRPLAAAKDMVLTLDAQACPADVVITLAPESFEIILGNLISNAIKYCEQGAEIKVSLQASETGVTLRCEDNGPGIAPADQPLIFERFSRLQQHAHIEGNGIGLSVVKQLVEIHGGELLLDSEAGRGTRFTITLPRSHEAVSQTKVDAVINGLAMEVEADQSPAQTIQRLDAVASEGEESSAVTAKPELLIIEDNLDMQQYILSELAEQFNCHLASNGQLGVDACIKNVPDIVISDVMMPVMDGYAVANQLRQDQRTSHIPIVLLTALNTTQSRIKGWQEHVDSYLTKPFDSEELLIKLHSILAIRQLLQAKNAQRFGAQVDLDLPKIDNDFIKKLRRVIADHHTNPNLQRSHLASEMAISERQLLRKTKALINITPNDALREYRLEQAVKVLQTGKPVNLVSDACGFNSTSYFVRCFKAKYNITPKQYQKQLENQ